MKILNRYTNACLWESDHATMKDTLEAAVAASADLTSADLRSADLRYANLTSADLTSADLRSADLRYANLTSADLRSADLRSANLTSADLRSADLRSANLTSANLRYANLTSANGLTDETSIGTETWGVYKSEVVPQLLRAGGRPLADLLAAGAWECNSWTNCPAAFAFGVHAIDAIPALYRPRVEQFIGFFDAHMLPREIIEEAIAKEDSRA